MATEKSSPRTTPEHPLVHVERTDVSYRGVMWVLLASIPLAVVIHVGVFWYFRAAHEKLADDRRSTFPLAPAPVMALPRKPRLEQLDRLSGSEQDTLLRDANQRAALNSYAPGDAPGFVRVPIERAMQRLADKLPARKGEERK